MLDNPYAAIKIQDFRTLLLARLMVTIAVQAQSVAIGWQVYALTKDPLFLGFIGLAEVIPSLGISLYAGHVADIIDRRRIALFSVGSLIISLTLLGACSMTLKDSQLLIPSIFSLVAFTGFARGFYGPAVFGILSDIVPENLYGNATAWNTATWQASAIAGPVIGGFGYVYFGATFIYFAAAFLLLLSFCGFLAVKSRTRLNPKREGSVMENMSEGLRFVFSNEIVLGAMALDLFAVLFGGAVALLPMFTSEIFHTGPHALGMLRAAPSVGALLTAVLLTHYPITRNSGAIFLAAVAGFGVCMISFGLSTNFYVALIALSISGALDGISIWIRTTIFQLLTPHNMKGRVAAVNGIFIGSSNELGEFESGVTAKIMGLVPSVVFGGCMTLLVVLITMFKAPKLRQLHMDSLYKNNLSA
jgi:MFS family permease